MRLVSLLLCIVSLTAFAQLDSSVLGDMAARAIGPATMSGRITDIDVHPDNTNVIYVGTASGGLWKSEDGGVRYEPIFDDYPQSIGTVTIDPSEPDTIWVGAGEINTRNSVSYGYGLYKSTDGGETWKHLGFEDSERIAEIRIHPNDSNVAYIAVLGHLWGDSEERGLYKTTDGGENFERLLYVDETTGCIDIDIDPQEPDTIYAAMWQVRRWPYFFKSGGPGSGLYKSTDGGKTFKELRNGLPEGDLGRIDLDIAPSRPNRLYAVVESENTALYRSDDLGESWEEISAPFGIQARPFYLSIIKVDPNDHLRLYNPSLFLSVSTDGGKSWPGGFGFGGGVHPDHQAIWINPDNSDHVLLGTDGGLYESRNGTASWTLAGALPVSQFYRIAADDAVPYNVYGGLQDNGSWMAPSQTPGGLSNAHWTNLGGGDGFCVIPDGTNPNYVYWEMQGGVLSRLDLSTQENKNIVPYPEAGMDKNRFNWNAPLVRSLTNPKTLYFGSQYLYKTQDHGNTWKRISPDLTTNDPEKLRQEESGGLTKDATTAENHCTIFAIGESPLDENLIWVGTDDGNLQVTKDGGQNWTNVVANVPDLPANTWVSYVKPSAHDKGTVYATFTGHRSGDKTPYVYKSTDYGQTWTSLVTETLKSHAHVIWQDSVNANLLFLGMEIGLFVSLDDGANWSHFRNGLPQVSVRDMVVQEREADLVIGTHGRGIYIIHDITPLRTLSTDSLKEKAVLLASRPGRSEKPRGVQNFPGDGYFTAEPAPSGVMITYHLKRRHLFGDLKLEIYDDSGELVTTLIGGKRKGINRVPWNMRQRPPKASRASGLNFNSFFGPYVNTGTYKVKMIKGKDTYETEIELLPPLNSPFSDAQRAERYTAVMKMYGLQEEVSFVTDQLGDLVEQIEERTKDAKENRNTKKLAEKVDAIKDMRSELVESSASIFVSKQRMRDEVINLYAALSEYSGPPSNNQTQQMETLAGRWDDFQKRVTPMMELTEVNRLLERMDQEPVKLLDKETWLDDDEGGEATGPMPKKILKYFYRNVAPWVYSSLF